MELIVEAQHLTHNLMAALCALREHPKPICDRCQDPDEIVVTTVEIREIDETFALCGVCTSELPRGFHLA